MLNLLKMIMIYICQDMCCFDLILLIRIILVRDKFVNDHRLFLSSLSFSLAKNTDYWLLYDRLN